jgi:transcription initiation factor IIE alpha subunit
MATAFRTMQAEHREVLTNLNERMTSKDLGAKLPQLELSRVRGILRSLQFRGLVGSRTLYNSKITNWYRTEAGDRVANR